MMRTILPLEKTCTNARIALLVALILLGGFAHKVQSHADLDGYQEQVCGDDCNGSCRKT